MHIQVKVKTGARREEMQLIGENRFLLSVKERAAAGAANRRVLALVAKHFARPLADVRLIRGQTTPNKLLSIKD